MSIIASVAVATLASWAVLNGANTDYASQWQYYENVQTITDISTTDGINYTIGTVDENGEAWESNYTYAQAIQYYVGEPIEVAYCDNATPGYIYDDVIIAIADIPQTYTYTYDWSYYYSWEYSYEYGWYWSYNY